MSEGFKTRREIIEGSIANQKRQAEEYFASLKTEPEQEKPEADLDAKKVQPEKKKRGRPKKVENEVKPAAEPAETPTVEISGLAEPTVEIKSEPEKQEPPDVIKSLNEEKKKVEAQISVETDENVKIELLRQKRNICEQIIEAFSKKTGKNIREEIKKEEQKQLEISVSASGFKNMENYERTMRDRYLNEIILASNLSSEQKNGLIKEGEIIVSNWPSIIVLDKEELSVCIRMGIDVNKIKGSLFSKKIKIIKKGAPNEADNLNDFEKILKASQEMAQINEEARQKIEQRKNEIIDKGVTDFVLNKKVAEIMGSVEEDEDNKKWEELEKKWKEGAPEFSENPKETRSLKIETPDDQLKNLESLRASWDQTNIISIALKENKKATLPDGEVLDPNKEEDRALLENAKNSLSDEIINIAGKISGRNLRKEAETAVNYDPDKKDLIKQKEFRDWLTKEVQKIYEKSIEELKIVAQVSGKNIALKDIRPPQKIKEEIEKKYPFNSTF